MSLAMLYFLIVQGVLSPWLCALLRGLQKAWVTSSFPGFSGLWVQKSVQKDLISDFSSSALVKPVREAKTQESNSYECVGMLRHLYVLAFGAGRPLTSDFLVIPVLFNKYFLRNCYVSSSELGTGAVAIKEDKQNAVLKEHRSVAVHLNVVQCWVPSVCLSVESCVCFVLSCIAT